jgi:acyl carrier protein
MNIEEKVKAILSELSGEDTIDNATALQEELALDSLMMVTLLMEIEDTFAIELDESDMNPFDLETVQSVIDLVMKYCGGDKNG